MWSGLTLPESSKADCCLSSYVCIVLFPDRSSIGDISFVLKSQDGVSQQLSARVK